MMFLTTTKNINTTLAILLIVPAQELYCESLICFSLPFYLYYLLAVSLFQVLGSTTQNYRHESYCFRVSNSSISADYKYFLMVHKENQGKRIDRYGAPENNSLTEKDRKYLNIIKTEDGLSQFFKTKRDPL